MVKVFIGNRGDEDNLAFGKVVPYHNPQLQAVFFVVLAFLETVIKDTYRGCYRCKGHPAYPIEGLLIGIADVWHESIDFVLFVEPI